MSDLIKIAYEDLANAIIVQASRDYVGLLQGATPTTEVNIFETEKFFKSEWFRVLTKIDGETMMDKLRRECGQCV